MRFRVMGALFLVGVATGCLPQLKRADLNRFKAAGKVALVVAPSRWTAHNVLGAGPGTDELTELYGAPPPWRGERLVGVAYQPGFETWYPFGIDLRAIKRQ